MTTYNFGSAPSGPRISDPPDNPAIVAARNAWNQARKNYDIQRNAAREALRDAEAAEKHATTPEARAACASARITVNALYAPLARLEQEEVYAAYAYELAQENAVYNNARDAGRTHDEAQRAVNLWRSNI